MPDDNSPLALKIDIQVLEQYLRKHQTMSEDNPYAVCPNDDNYKIVSITGAMLATTDEYHGNIQEVHILNHNSVNGDYLRTSMKINGHQMYVKIRGAPMNTWVDKFAGQVCIWKHPSQRTAWLVGEPKFCPLRFHMALIQVPQGEEELDLVELVDKAEKQGRPLDVQLAPGEHRTVSGSQSTLGDEHMISISQKNACIRVKHIKALMTDLLANADEYASRVRLNDTVFKCSICLDEHQFKNSLIAPCGHVFGRDCYLKQSQQKINAKCPLGCPVSLQRYNTPYTFPIEQKLRYDYLRYD